MAIFLNEEMKRARTGHSLNAGKNSAAVFFEIDGSFALEIRVSSFHVNEFDNSYSLFCIQVK